MLLAPANSPQFKLQVFEGPLDLLLHLIRDNKIDIYDIPIAEITKQYLDYLAMMEMLDLAIAGEYLVIAATLLEIKSRMLLPSQIIAIEEGEEEDPRAELVEKLLEYQRYQGTVETLRGWEESRRLIYFRGALENPDDFALPLSEGDITVQQLLAALHRVLSVAGVDEAVVTAVVPRRRVSLRMKMAEVIRRVKMHPKGLAFDLLFEPPILRYEVVLTFLALLELIRMMRVKAIQKAALGEIMLYSLEAAG